MSELRLIAERIKRRVSVRAVAKWFGFDYTAKGERARYACPICHETSHSKATVSVFDGDNGLEAWHCFSCDTGGDCISWLAARLDCEPYQSITKLAAMIGVVVDDDAIIGFMTDEIKGVFHRAVAEDGRRVSALRAVRAAWWKWRNSTDICDRDDDRGFFAAEFCNRLALTEYFELRAMEGDSLAGERLAVFLQSPVVPTVLGSHATTAMRNLSLDYNERAITNPIANKYIAHRRWTQPDIGERFSVGYCPVGFDPLTNDQDRKTLNEYGVIHDRRTGGNRHTMEGRVVFPIHSLSGRTIAFAGRSLTDEHQPKYLNTSDTALFRKRLTLYGLAENLASIVRRRKVIVTEGYADVLAMARMGSEITVAAMGTALTTDHAEVLSRVADEVVLLMDGDDAGQAAADRAVDILRSTRYRLAVATLPPGMDPDDAPPGAVRRALAARRPVEAPRKGPGAEWMARLLRSGR